MEVELSQTEVDVNNGLSTSHKRVSCNPAFYTPEPKRQQLSMPLSDDLPTLGSTHFEDDKFVSNRFCTHPMIDNLENNSELVFDCELNDREHACMNRNNNESLNLNSGILNTTPLTGVDNDTNIANSTNYISSLFNIMGSTGNLYFCSSCDENTHLNDSVAQSFNTPVKNNSDPTDLTINNNFDNVNCESTASDDIDERIKDEEDFLLKNLPTSIDDFQNKEFHLKLERNISSPHVSRLQSPSGLPEFADCASKTSIISNLLSSTHQSVSSTSDDLDDNDLEVAMINESFEEQQKQSQIYDCMNLKSLFYGIPPLPPDIHNNSTRYVIDSNEPSTSDYPGTANDEFNFGTISNTPVKHNEFIPVLTPKSKQFLLKRRKLARDRSTNSSKSYTNVIDHEQVFDNIVGGYNSTSEEDEEKSRRLDMELEKMMLSSDENERIVYSKYNADVTNYDKITTADEDQSLKGSRLLSRLLRQNRVSEVEVDVLNQLPYIVQVPLTAINDVCNMSLSTTTDYMQMEPSCSVKKDVISEEGSDKEDQKSSLDEACIAAEHTAFGVVASLFESPIPEEFENKNSSPITSGKVNMKMAEISKYENSNNNCISDVSFSFSVDNAEEEYEPVYLAENNGEEEENSIELNATDYNLINSTASESAVYCKNDLVTSVSCNDEVNSTPNFGKKSLYVNGGLFGQSLSSMNSSSTSVGDLGGNSIDEQKVPVLDNWENLADDQELAEKMISKAKNNFDKLKAVKNVEKFSYSNIQPSESEQDFPLHVLEANCQVPLKSEREVEEAIQFLIGAGSSDIWHKKVDDKNFLLVFPSAEKASEALFLKNSSILKLKSLSEASSKSQTMAIQWKSMLVGNKRRPTTTANVARRMIANSLNIRIPVSEEQRRKEMQLLNMAKERKNLKNAIWNE